jgi:hypothetical protein
LYDEFVSIFQKKLLPTLMKQPGFVRAEVYSVGIPEHWITLISWLDIESRNLAVEAESARFYSTFAPYEKPRQNPNTHRDK